jgi:hypothetical protein
VVKASGNYMFYRGVSQDEYKTLSRDIVEMLPGTSLTAREIKSALETDLDVSSILYYMCDKGILLRDRPVNDWRDKNHRYTLFEEAFPEIDLEKVSDKEANTYLVKHYIDTFGPVTEEDIVWWTGLGKIRIRAALRNLKDQIVSIRVCDFPDEYLMLATGAEQMRNFQLFGRPVVNLLPSLDPYIMGYSKRNRYIDPSHYNKVFDDLGNATNTIMIDGKVRGVWDYVEDPEPMLMLHLFEYLQLMAGERLIAEAKRLGQFMAGKKVRIKQCDQMTPLTERSAGSFMSPLKEC